MPHYVDYTQILLLLSNKVCKNCKARIVKLKLSIIPLTNHYLIKLAAFPAIPAIYFTLRLAGIGLRDLLIFCYPSKNRRAVPSKSPGQY